MVEKQLMDLIYFSVKEQLTENLAVVADNENLENENSNNNVTSLPPGKRWIIFLQFDVISITSSKTFL